MTGVGAAVDVILLVFAAGFLTGSTGLDGKGLTGLGCSSAWGLTVAVGC